MASFCSSRICGFKSDRLNAFEVAPNFFQEKVRPLGQRADLRKQIVQLLRNRLVRGRGRGTFQAQEVMQPPFGILQDLIGLIQIRKGCVRGAGGAAARLSVRMCLQGLLMIRLLQLIRIEPGRARLIEKSEVIDHAAKLSPQEQWATAFGFVTLKPPFCRSSL